MQTATYVGLRARGPWGALASFMDFGLPAFVFMVLLAPVYQRTNESQPVISAFRGLQLVVIALMANATVNFGRNSIWQRATPC